MSSIGRSLTPLALIVLLLVSACGGGSNTNPGTTPQASARFPMTIENCGQRTTITAPPKRVLVLDNQALSLLTTSALDKVVAVAGDTTAETSSQDLRQRVEKIPTIGHGTSDGGIEITLEQVIAQRPDLAIGLAANGLKRDALASVGIPVIELPAFCSDTKQRLTNPGWEDVYSQVEFYGRLFGTEDDAARTVADLRTRVAAAQKSAQGLSGRTAATLFITPGNPTVYAYGGQSTFDLQMRTLGLTNIFGDVTQRAFEANLEEVIARNPEVVILGHATSDPEKIKQQFLGIAGINRTQAVRNDQILAMRWEYAEPPTPLSVQGLEMIAKKFAGAR